jgi:hypothetical protein
LGEGRQGDSPSVIITFSEADVEEPPLPGGDGFPEGGPDGDVAVPSRITTFGVGGGGLLLAGGGFLMVILRLICNSMKNSSADG